MGQWFSQHTDYETVYAGKWHLPRTYTDDIPGFRVLHTGIGGFGYLCDTLMSRACEGFLRNRSKDKPFLMIASFMQPHDICEWLRFNMNDPGSLRHDGIADSLPPLPDNFEFDPAEPASVAGRRLGNEPFRGRSKWTRQHWRYYRWSYYRHIEQLDAEIGRVLRALDDFGYGGDTLIALTSDHGEGMGHHQMVRKSSLYDEASKVPLLLSWPGHIRSDVIDRTYLVSGLDIMPTLCDYAGIAPPPNTRGASLRPVLDEPSSAGRGFVVTESNSNTGRMLRTDRYKYIRYVDETGEQLFDMKNDPGETKNLAASAKYDSVLAEHRKLLADWELRLDVPASTPHASKWRRL
jgi:choline-sulfatase